jgi:hypothetical protein
MSASFLVKALSDRSEHFYTGQDSLLEAVKCSKSGDHRRISEILQFLRKTYDTSLTKNFPKEVYTLLKTASKITSPQIQEIIHNSDSRMLFKHYEEAAAIACPKKSVSVADGDGGEVRVNSTAVRLFFPELMAAARNFFKENASSAAPAAEPAGMPIQERGKPVERPKKRAKVGEAQPQDVRAAALPKPKYEISKDFFPFLEGNALKGLLCSCGGPAHSPLSMRETLQALAAAKLVESQNPHSKNAVSESFFYKLCDFFTHEDREKPCSLSNDGLILLAYVIASSKALEDSEEGRDAPPGVLDVGSEEMNSALAPFACLTKGQVERMMSYYKQSLLSPERMTELCQNNIFFAALSQCDELRRITVRVRTHDETNLMLMMQNEKLNRLSWEIRRIGREGIQFSERIEHRDAAQ